MTEPFTGYPDRAEERRAARLARRASYLAGILAAICLWGCLAAPEGAGPERRKVLIITVDTLRADHLGAAGFHLPATPFIDSLLAEGTRFTRAVTPIPRTTQALASLLTGRYPHRHGVRTLFDTMSPGATSIAEVASRSGYATMAVVSNHILVPGRGLERGFDVYDHAGDAREAEETTARAIHHLNQLRDNEKIFAWIHYIDPHVPYFPDPALARRFDPGYKGPYRLSFGSIKGGTGDAAYPPDLPKRRAVFQNDLPEEVNDHIRKLYAADIRQTDDQIARLVRWIRSEMGKDWLIVLAADHGESLGEHGYFFDHGDYVYDASLRIPMGIVLPPGDRLHQSGVVRQRVSLVDLAPTLAELMGWELQPEELEAMEGRSLVPALRGEPLTPRPVFAECGKSFFPDMIPGRRTFDVAGRFRAVMSGDYKLILTPGRGAGDAVELYDLVRDPREEREISRDRPEKVRQMRALLREWMRHAQDGVAPEDKGPTEEDLEILRSLGYVGSAKPAKAPASKPANGSDAP